MKTIGRYANIIRSSIGASLLIGLGDYVLLRIGEPIGPFLFALGLLGVCVLELNLFTGKCGFLVDDDISVVTLLLILAVNLAAGYGFGALLGIMDPTVTNTALDKASGWECSLEFFIKSAMCGAIMYLAVALYRRGTVLGILIGVPLFIFCGFQHSIANTITLGATGTFSLTILFCAIGNMVGSLMTWAVCTKVLQTESEPSENETTEPIRNAAKKTGQEVPQKSTDKRRSRKQSRK